MDDDMYEDEDETPDGCFSDVVPEDGLRVELVEENKAL